MKIRARLALARNTVDGTDPLAIDEDHPLVALPHLGQIALEVAGDIDDQAQLGNFRGLDIDDAERNPAPATVDLATDDQDHEQQQQPAAVRLPQCPTLELAGLLLRDVDQQFVDHVDLGHHHEPAADLQQVEDVDVLDRLLADPANTGQILVMLPEIALTGQWLSRFKQRFGCAPALWHSDLTGKQRAETWRAVAEGEARVVVGARSALFLPFRELEMIILDEEHDGSFKQEDGVVYQARDMAVVRANIADCPIVLASATPSLETVLNANEGRYQRLILPSRHGGATMPTVSVINLREDRPERGTWLAPTLVEAVEKRLAAGEQSLLFLNRRGYAPLTLCNACGHRYKCPSCDAWLTEHRLARRLVCHHCGFQSKSNNTCTACGEEDSLVACGPGVERVGEEVIRRFPDARVAIGSSDTMQRHSIRELIQAVERGEIDILVGTQILAKGYHFPNLTLVGVVDADLSLYGSDIRASEKTFQLLHQVAGRAGRAEIPGEVMLQTHEPDHPVMQALIADERDAFYDTELGQREMMALPPFGRLAAVVVSDPDEDRLDAFCRELVQRQPREPEDTDGVKVLGPASAPIAVVRGRHRRRFLVRGAPGVRLQPYLARWLGGLKTPGALRMRVDIDPYSFL